MRIEKQLRLLKLNLKSLVMRARIHCLRQKGVEVGQRGQTSGRIQVFRALNSSIQIGDNVVLTASTRQNMLEARGPVILRTIFAASSIRIGSDTGMTSATISAARQVCIGDRVLIGAGVLITDSDHHVIDPPVGTHRRYAGMPEPRDRDRIFIGNDVFVGARSVILKGVKIGEGSVIGAGSIVSRDVPEWSVAAGNPCIVVGTVRR